MNHPQIPNLRVWFYFSTFITSKLPTQPDNFVLPYHTVYSPLHSSSCLEWQLCSHLWSSHFLSSAHSSAASLGSLSVSVLPKYKNSFFLCVHTHLLHLPWELCLFTCMSDLSAPLLYHECLELCDRSGLPHFTRPGLKSTGLQMIKAHLPLCKPHREWHKIPQKSAFQRYLSRLLFHPSLIR